MAILIVAVWVLAYADLHTMLPKFHISHPNQHLSWQFTDTLPALAPISVPVGFTANTMFAWDNGYANDSVGSVAFGSRRFNMSLDISVAEILIEVHFASKSSYRSNSGD